MYFIHPDDETLPRTGTWCDDFATFDDACRFYGADTHDSIEAEIADRVYESHDLAMDDMEAAGVRFEVFSDEIPF